jgi:uncharacterized membrane protein YkvA (DUF1232 family)
MHVLRNIGPGRLAALRALWRALSAAGRPGAPGIAERLVAVPRMVGAAVSGRYPHLSAGRVLLAALAGAYLLSPLDVVPELLLSVVGLVDDAVVALWLGGVFLSETQRFLEWERARPVVVDAEPAQARPQPA